MLSSYRINIEELGSPDVSLPKENCLLDLEPFGYQYSPLYGENPGKSKSSKILISFRPKKERHGYLG